MFLVAVILAVFWTTPPPPLTRSILISINNCCEGAWARVFALFYMIWHVVNWLSLEPMRCWFFFSQLVTVLSPTKWQDFHIVLNINGFLKWILVMCLFVVIKNKAFEWYVYYCRLTLKGPGLTAKKLCFRYELEIRIILCLFGRPHVASVPQRKVQHYLEFVRK